MIDGVLRLKSIVCCTVEGLQAFEKLDDPIAQAWREAQKIDPVELRTEIWELAGCGRTTFDKYRKEWLAAYNVDIEIPRAFYRDLRTYSPASLILPDGRDALLAARDQQDGDETLRLLDDADGDFFFQVNEVVGKAISGPLTLLPTKVAGETPAVAGPTAGAIASKPSPNRGPQVQGGPPAKPASSRSATESSAVASVSGGNPKSGHLTIRRGTLPKKTAGQSLLKPIILSHRKLNFVAKTNIIISQAKARLRVAQTDKERDDLNKKIRVLEGMLHARAETARKRQQALRMSKEVARRKRMSDPRV
jgi:hypothetical protein